MKEMNLSDIIRPRNNLEQVKVITTQSSRKIRSEEEMIMIMRSTRNRFRRAVESGRIEIISKYEWRLH